MVRIKVRKDESFSQALRRFNKKVSSAGIVREALERQEYTKPTEERRQERKRKQRKIYLENKYKNRR